MPSHANVYKKLVSELDFAIPDPTRVPPLLELEKLPYLTCVIMEVLRLANGVAKRLTRSQPDNALQYGDYVIPPGTRVGMTAILLHENPEIFPDPYEFRPERWEGEKGQQLQKYLVVFNRGNRNCIGQTLAWAELYKAFACFFRRFSFELVDVVRSRDVDIGQDLFVVGPSRESRGVRLRIKGMRP